MFHAGQKVECVKKILITGYEERFGIAVPTVGSLYHIRAISAAGATPIVLLHEIRNPAADLDNGTHGEPWFVGRAFRPVYDISVFTALLNTSKIKERV